MHSKKLDKILKYKGYYGEVILEPNGEYSGNIICIDNRGIKDNIRYDGSTFRELNENFKHAVDIYINSCEQKENAMINADKSNINGFMFYNGNTAIVDMCEDGRYYGRVVGIPHLFFRGDTLKETRQKFHEIIDLYLKETENE